jgi:hypothetical protein
LEAKELAIQPEHRRKGIATEMYRFARELGNDITPSRLQTDMGKQFWNKDHSKELAETMEISEFQLPKNEWTMLISSADKQEIGGELVDLVKHAYSFTPQGSFVNSIRDVVPSDWEVIDWDQNPDVDATVFHRANRSGEAWVGHKIQGIGHDGQKTSKERAIAKVQSLLTKSGWWIESSDAMEHILKKLSMTPVSDHRFLMRLFNDPHLKMVDEDTYTRKLSHGVTLRETVFGKPVLK